MQLGLTLNIPALAIFDPAKARTIVQQELTRGMTRIVQPIATLARANAPVDRGVLRAAVYAVVTQSPSGTGVQGTVGVSDQAPYAADVEYGTPPHWITDISGLKDWAKRVMGDEQRAYAVRYAIAREGTEPQPFLGPAIDAIAPSVPGVLDAAVARAITRLEQP
jgi:HK97 gp10 family phage protein